MAKEMEVTNTLTGSPGARESSRPPTAATSANSTDHATARSGEEAIKAEKFGFADPETHYDDFTFIDLTTVTGDLTPTSEVPAQEPTEAATTETSASIAAEPESSEPTFVRCLADLTIYALYSDGSTRITPSCENDPAVQRAARAEGVCGGLYAPEGTTAEEYLDLCGVPIRTSPPSAPESVAPVSPVAPEPANGNTPGQ